MYDTYWVNRIVEMVLFVSAWNILDDGQRISPGVDVKRLSTFDMLRTFTTFTIVLVLVRNILTAQKTSELRILATFNGKPLIEHKNFPKTNNNTNTAIEMIFTYNCADEMRSY